MSKRGSWLFYCPTSLSVHEALGNCSLATNNDHHSAIMENITLTNLCRSCGTHPISLLGGVVPRGQQHVCQSRAAGCIGGGRGAWSSRLQQGLLGTAPVDLGAAFLGDLSYPPCLAAATLQAGPSLHYGGASNLLQHAAQSCRGGGSVGVRVKGGDRHSRRFPQLWPCFWGLRDGACGGRGVVVWRDGRASALRLEEVLQAVAQRAHVLQGIVGNFGKAVIRLRCPPACLPLCSTPRVWLLRPRLLATTLVHQEAPVSLRGSAQGWGLAKPRLHQPSDRLFQKPGSRGWQRSGGLWECTCICGLAQSHARLPQKENKMDYVMQLWAMEHKQQLHELKSQQQHSIGWLGF